MNYIQQIIQKYSAALDSMLRQENYMLHCIGIYISLRIFWHSNHHSLARSLARSLTRSLTRSLSDTLPVPYCRGTVPTSRPVDRQEGWCQIPHDRVAPTSGRQRLSYHWLRGWHERRWWRLETRRVHCKSRHSLHDLWARRGTELLLPSVCGELSRPEPTAAVWLCCSHQTREWATSPILVVLFRKNHQIVWAHLIKTYYAR